MVPTIVESLGARLGLPRKEGLGSATIAALSKESNGTVTVAAPEEKSHPEIACIVDKFPDLKSEKIGRFPDFQHTIKLSEDAIPVARKNRRFRLLNVI